MPGVGAVVATAGAAAASAAGAAVVAAVSVAAAGAAACGAAAIAGVVTMAARAIAHPGYFILTPKIGLLEKPVGLGPPAESGGLIGRWPPALKGG